MMADKNKYLVSTDWLAEHLKKEHLRVIDASWYLPSEGRSPSEEYKKSHIPTAIYFDLDSFSDQESSLPHMATTPEIFSNKIEKFGIAENSIVVVYDGLGIFSAARLLWLFHLYGFENVFILDGGLPKWLSERKPTSSAIEPVIPRSFPVKYNEDLVVEFNMVASVIESETVQIVDARPPGRFKGLSKEPRPGVRPGNIPGSINLFYGNLFNNDKTLKSDKELMELINLAGIDLKKHLITSCGSGVTAAILYFVFKGLGAKKISIYDGSWCEWGSKKI